jgi:hypothetical protein
MSLRKYILKESPMISSNRGVVFADAQKLKSLKVEDIENNIVFMRQPTNGVLPEGFTLVYLMDTEENAQKMKNGELNYLILPSGMIGYGTPPFQKVFTKPDDKRREVHHILGFVQAMVTEEEIWIEFMKVRKEYRRNSVNSKMIDIIKNEYPNAKVTYYQPTPDGKKFMNSRDNEKA